MKIAIYSRKSKFTGKGESVENQVQLCRDYIERNLDCPKNTIIDVYEDEDFQEKIPPARTISEHDGEGKAKVL